MQTYAFIGSSGTGKSHRASFLAFQNSISLIVDDGLLISGNSVLAGKSAKRETTRIGAVKRAIFHDPAHAREVREKIAESCADKILLIGTSEKMVLRIADRLKLPPPTLVIRIEDIASPRAIGKALEMRSKENRHVIPIPSFAIEKDFPGYLIAPLRSIWGKSHREDTKTVVIERSIVRPIYSTLGKNYISESVVEQLVTHVVSRVPGIARVLKVDVFSETDGASLHIEVNVFYGEILHTVLKETQKQVKETVENLTGFNLRAIHVTARRIELRDMPYQGHSH